MTEKIEPGRNAEKALIGLLYVGGLFWMVKASQIWGLLLGFGIMAAGEIHRSRKDYRYHEVWEGSVAAVNEVFDSSNTALYPMTARWTGTKQRVVTGALKQLPLGKTLASRIEQKASLSTDWMPEFAKRSAIIVGESDDGKTHTLLWRLKAFIEAHPEGEIHIGDIDYGSSHGKRPNTWFDLPLDSVVHTDPAEILDALLLVDTEVSERAERTKDAIATKRSKPTFKPILLLIDEWVNTVDYWRTDQREQALKALKNITHRGLKQNIQVVLGMHSLAVSQSGISKGLLQHLEVLLLWRAAQNPDNYDNLPPSRATVNAIVEHFKPYPQSIGAVRACVAYFDKRLSIRGIPHLNIQVELVAPGEVILAWIAQQIDVLRPHLPGLTYTKAWSLVGGKSGDRRNNNPDYVALKSLVDQLNQAAKTDSPSETEAEKPDSPSNVPISA
jgi:hypothetical protein